MSAPLQSAAADVKPEATKTKEIRARIAELGPWFHNLRLDGIETAPDHFLGDYPRLKFERFRECIPSDLAGKTVLDIGCNAGFYSMEMKRRGASQVLGIDPDEHYLRQARFAADVEGLEIEFLPMTVWDIASLRRRFDVVLFMGVFYHLRHPLLALDLIYEHVAGDVLLFQSMQRGSGQTTRVDENYGFGETSIFDQVEFPKLHFIEHSYCSDPTNWWIPNRACSEAMLRSAGFRIEAHPEEEVYFCRKNTTALPPGETYCVYPSSPI